MGGVEAAAQINVAQAWPIRQGGCNRPVRRIVLRSAALDRPPIDHRAHKAVRRPMNGLPRISLTWPADAEHSVSQAMSHPVRAIQRLLQPSPRRRAAGCGRPERAPDPQPADGKPYEQQRSMPHAAEHRLRVDLDVVSTRASRRCRQRLRQRDGVLQPQITQPHLFGQRLQMVFVQGGQMFGSDRWPALCGAAPAGVPAAATPRSDRPGRRGSVCSTSSARQKPERTARPDRSSGSARQPVRPRRRSRPARRRARRRADGESAGRSAVLRGRR